MEAIVNFLEEVVTYTAQIGIRLIELAGIMVLMITSVQGIIGYFKKDPHIRLKLAQGIALALAFHWRCCSRWAARCCARCWPATGTSWPSWVQSSACAPR